MKKYPKYKASGVEWIGEIPEHWIINKFSRAAFFQEGPGLRNWQFKDEGVKVICVTNIVPPNIIFGKYIKYISNEEYESSYKHFTVSKGDIMLASSGASWGKVAEYDADEIVILNTSTIRLNTNSEKNVDRTFIKWLIQSPYIAEQLNFLLTGSCQPNFGPTHLKQLVCAYPKNIEDQIKIANYLDYKTKEIETLITNKQKLIVLLQEERTAIINHAVTKGVTLSGVEGQPIKLKPSGIEWLGDIPEHWEVKKLKYLLKETRDSLKTGPFGSHLKNSDLIENGEVKVYTQRNVLDNDFDSGEDFIDLEKYETLKGFKVEPNDILITTRGTIGRCAEFPKDKQIGILHPCLIRIQVDVNKANPKWIMNYINNTTYFSNNVKHNSNSTIIDVIYGYTLKEIVFPAPPLNEQSIILDYIVGECFRFNTIITKTEQEIELLKEYKTALISEVVTGKVDVRDEKIK